MNSAPTPVKLDRSEVSRKDARMNFVALARVLSAIATVVLAVVAWVQVQEVKKLASNSNARTP
jgi:hypothetical protein